MIVSLWMTFNGVSRGSDNLAHSGQEAPPCCSPAQRAVTPVIGSAREIAGAWSTDDGQKFEFQSLGGHPCVIAMFYASCEMTCPMTLQAMRDLESRLPAAARKEVRFVLVTLDPQNDTPRVLKSYRRKEGLADNRWILLHGSPRSVAELAGILGISYGEDTFGRRSHSSGISVLDETGRVALSQTDLNGDFRPMLAYLRAAAAPQLSK